MPAADRQMLRDAMFALQMSLGWCFPNAVMQYAVPALDRLSIDVRTLARRRDVLSEVLTRAGHVVLPPEGTFYLWVKWSSDDPARQWNALVDRDVFVMPGSIMNAPDHFRISLTASDEMIARALPVFAAMV
jgi:aspartate aminotransferase